MKMEDKNATFSPIPTGLPWSIRGVETLLQRHPSLTHRWHYEPGVALLAVQRVWEQTQEQHYFDYIRANIDELVDASGQICTYDPQTYNLDQINQGKVLFVLYAQTGEIRYKNAILRLRQQMETHPRTQSGGYWHKRIYPHQMWLDGVYMADPFLAQFARDFDEPRLFDDSAYQVLLLARQARDPRTGLLYHAWDESRSQQWADPQTGCSPHFWGRALGWFMMALPDILDHFPSDHPQRNDLVQVLRETAEAVISVQDPLSGLWFQILDQGDRPGNYLEASASCMFVYALAKSARLGYLEETHLPAVQRGYQGLLERFIEVDPRGWVDLHGIVSVGGLGGSPYRDGSFEYYLSEPVVSNDYKGFGPFIMASLEIEKANQAIGGSA
jgi:unsaturated rhamnogalacturonyl hydrolase